MPPSPDGTDEAGGPPQPFTVLSRMRARRRDEAHRVATPLELFFDLAFAAAVAQAGQRCSAGATVTT
jgi:low temperature requirement protein LtrA